MVTKKDQKFAVQNWMLALLPSITHTAPISYCEEILEMKGEVNSSKNNYEGMRTSKEQLIYGDSRPDLWEDCDPEEEDTQASQ